MKKNFFIYCFCLFTISCDVSPPPTNTLVSITLDEKHRYQTIDGFGGFGAKAVWWSSESFSNADFVDLLIEDLGLTILRDNLPLSFEPSNDNDDPMSINWAGFNVDVRTDGSDSALADHLQYLSEMKKAGLTKLIVSIWSPPLWMKHTAHRGNGLKRGETSAPDYIENPESGVSVNQLQKRYYQEFAEYCVAYISYIKSHTGLDVYAISLQNEPRFSQWYASAVYSPEALAELIGIVGERFAKEGIETKIFAPEDVGHIKYVEKYIHAIAKNPDALKHTDIFAIHDYKNDGVNWSSLGQKKWEKIKRLAKKHKKQVWMTETSGLNGDEIDDVLKYSGSIYNALKYGSVSAWVHWQLNGEHKSTFLKDGKPKLIFFFAKQFYRHIRPGFVRVNVTGESQDVKALGFVSDKTQEKIAVLINFSKKIKSVSLAGIKLKNISCWASNESLRHEPIPCPELSQVMVVPAQTVMTIVAKEDS